MAPAKWKAYKSRNPGVNVWAELLDFAGSFDAAELSLKINEGAIKDLELTFDTLDGPIRVFTAELAVNVYGGLYVTRKSESGELENVWLWTFVYGGEVSPRDVYEARVRAAELAARGSAVKYL